MCTRWWIIRSQRRVVVSSRRIIPTHFRIAAKHSANYTIPENAGNSIFQRTFSRNVNRVVKLNIAIISGCMKIIWKNCKPRSAVIRTGLYLPFSLSPPPHNNYTASDTQLLPPGVAMETPCNILYRNDRISCVSRSYRDPVRVERWP